MTINRLGHQSWELRIGKLLQVYPQFDETPWIRNPAKYEWPDADNLYCGSGGKDPSVLFAGEVRALHDHLAQKDANYGSGETG